MGRIRTIKPEFFLHEELFDAEQSEGLPLRLAFAGLWTCCDKEGRFEWRPRALKTDILPYDNIDFSRVLDALVTRGFVVRYRVDGKEYGFVPGFSKHQVINNRERESDLPKPPQSVETNAYLTRGARVNDASATRHGNAQAEREGEREGEREDGGGGSAGEREADLDPPQQDLTEREQILAAMGVSQSGLTGPSGYIGGQGDMAEAQRWLALPGMSLPVILTEIRRIVAAKQDGPPKSFRYFTDAMQRLSGQMSAPPLQPTAGQGPRAAAPPGPPRIRARLPSEIPPETMQ